MKMIRQQNPGVDLKRMVYTYPNDCLAKRRPENLFAENFSTLVSDDGKEPRCSRRVVPQIRRHSRIVAHSDWKVNLHPTVAGFLPRARKTELESSTTQLVGCVARPRTIGDFARAVRGQATHPTALNDVARVHRDRLLRRRNHQRRSCGHLLRVLDMQKLIRSVRIRFRAEHAGN